MTCVYRETMRRELALKNKRNLQLSSNPTFAQHLNVQLIDIENKSNIGPQKQDSKNKDKEQRHLAIQLQNVFVFRILFLFIFS